MDAAYFEIQCVVSMCKFIFDDLRTFDDQRTWNNDGGKTEQIISTVTGSKYKFGTGCGDKNICCFPLHLV